MQSADWSSVPDCYNQLEESNSYSVDFTSKEGESFVMKSEEGTSKIKLTMW